jgi:MFS family permease
MARQSSLLTPVLIGGSIILLLSMAIRSSFGLFQIPIAEEFGWLRAEFSLAIAIQNLAWGIGQPIFGAIAERFGDRRAIVLGAMLYAPGWCSRPSPSRPASTRFSKSSWASASRARASA